MNKANSFSDQELVGMAKAGDIIAFNKLLERYDNKIRQIIVFSINDHANVNDLAQEVLIKVYRFLPSFKNDCKFSTWLYRITQNIIKNYYRTLSQRLESESHFVSDQNQSSGHSPEHMVLNMEYNEKIDEALSKLSDELRSCYGMHTFDGQSYEEIANEMNCPVGTVKSRIYRARKLLISSIAKI